MDAVALILVLLATVCLPAVVAACLFADEVIDHLLGAFGQWREARHLRRHLDHLEPLSAMDGGDGAAGDAHHRPVRPAIEEIAADLRRLGDQRLSMGNQSRAWRRAVLVAYDGRLREASQSLGIREHLDELHGIDLEIERLRVEGELQAAGLQLTTHR